MHVCTPFLCICVSWKEKLLLYSNNLQQTEKYELREKRPLRDSKLTKVMKTSKMRSFLKGWHLSVAKGWKWKWNI